MAECCSVPETCSGRIIRFVGQRSRYRELSSRVLFYITGLQKLKFVTGILNLHYNH